MTAGRRRRIDQIPEKRAAIVGVNIRTLRQRNGWTQAELGELMGWPNASTVCAAEGHRNGRQRGFTTGEVRQLAAIFGITPWQLIARCENCNGRPPDGFSCLACGTMPTISAHRDRDCGQGHETLPNLAIPRIKPGVCADARAMRRHGGNRSNCTRGRPHLGR